MKSRADGRETFHHILDVLVRDTRGSILIFVAFGWFLSIGTRLIFPAILPELRATFGLSLSSAGFLLTVIWATYALGQLPGGYLGDRIGERNILVASTLGTGFTLGFVILSLDHRMLFVAAAIFGFVTAIYGTTRITVLSDVFPDRSGTVIGVTSAAGNVGNSVLPLLGGVLAALVTWRLSFGVLVPVFVLVAVGLWVSVPRRTSSDSSTSVPSRTIPRRVATALREPTVAPVAVVIVLGFFVWQGFTGFYPTYLVDVKGLDSSTAAILFGLFFAVGVIVEPLAGMARDAYGTRPTLTIAFGVQVAGFAILQSVEGLVGLLVVTVVLNSILAPTTIMFTHLSAALPVDVQGTALGFIRTVYMLIGATSPWLVGSLAGRALFAEAFWLLAGIAGVAAILCLFVAEP